MAKKSFQTYASTAQHEFDINGRIFHMKASVPGAVLLDFLGGANTDNPSEMARTINALLDEAIVPEELEDWRAFIREPANNVSLEILAEIAGFAAEVLSGGNPQQRPVSSLTG